LPPIFNVPVSADNNGRSGGFLASGLCIQKFRSRRLNFGRQRTSWRSGIVCREASFERRPNLLRIQSEGFELSAPLRRSVAEPFDTNAARQTTFDRGFDEVWCEERE